ncbi:MAG: DUF885 domain-containing protein [Hyphomonadaceae bacterium]
MLAVVCLVLMGCEAREPDATANMHKASEDLVAYLDGEFAEELEMNPQRLTQLGLKEHYGELDDYSSAHIDDMLKWRRDSVAEMKRRFVRDSLTPSGQLNYDIWALELERAEKSARYRNQDYVFGFNRPPHTAIPNFLINYHRVDTMDDMDAYVERLGQVARALDQSVAWAQNAAGDGIRMPRFQYERVISESRRLISGAPFEVGADSPLWADANKKIDGLVQAGTITDDDAADVRESVRLAMMERMKPGYERLIAWAEGDIDQSPSGRVGALTLPEGLDWYQAALNLHTTTQLTSKEVHELGLSEVERIHAEMEELAKDAGFATARDFLADRDARKDLVLPATDEGRAEYLRIANDEVAKARASLPQWFGELPAYPAVVRREPSFSEVPGGAAHASRATPDGSKPGEVFVHLLTPTGFLKTEITDLMCHEAIPGHLMQGDIMVRQKGVPQFRTAYAYAAFNEGWALYAEGLCKEMGMYPDAWSDYARLDGELWRAVRLVVDTGLHAMGWTEEEAVRYAKENTTEDDSKIRAEVRRYLTYPGQACSYKIGQLTILRLRKEAEEVLGDRFDIKGFNDAVIESGSLPLPILEARIADWVERQAPDAG